MAIFKESLRGRVTPADKARDDYLDLPFELPAPAARLSVRYHYTGAVTADRRDGNVIDIGLFDPRGAAFPGGAGFRGWSGSARAEFEIAPRQATPGYLPGPLPAGRYQIILGLYRIAPEGARFEVDIEAELEDGEQHQTDQPGGDGWVEGRHDEQYPPSTAGYVWLRGDLQSHTYHSDAQCTVAELVARARALRLDFLAVTDHNTISHHRELAALSAPDLLLIPGQEVTTYYGHMNVWGAIAWCDFRCRTADDMAAVIDLAHQQGGICSINHPKRSGPPWRFRYDLPVDALEVWQGPWPWRNEESLATWDRLLSTGRWLPAVGGSDYHCFRDPEAGYLRLGQPTTWVKARDRSTRGVLEAIRAGQVSISAFPDGPRVDVVATGAGGRAEMGGVLPSNAGDPIQVETRVERGVGWTLRLIADGVSVHEEAIDESPALIRTSLSATGYLRAEVAGDAPPELLPPDAPPDLDLRGWRWALSNPIYIGGTND